ncbi:MAG TPA: tetratricopeptide repeat protein [Candidatus Sulfotelmatobacter sp.]|nr:tetratricopeptide repeat protein [Candidatus Sulfotelmatobacter sp.]
MKRRIILVMLGVCALLPAPGRSAAGNLSLPPGTDTILEHIYSGRSDLAIPEAQALEREQPEHPLGYLLEAEARWWQIWCLSAEYKYGMSLPWHRGKAAGDQAYLDVVAKAEALAEAALAKHESAEMHLYAGMAGGLASRMYGLRAENRAGARAGVRAREHFMRALALDPTLADADMGLGLYNYYVDTLSAIARVLRFFMGIPGGSKEEGIRQLQLAIDHGQLTPALARYYLAVNLHLFDQKYEQALQVATPLVEKYPENPIFRLVRGDLYGKLGRKELAIADYRAAAAVRMTDAACQKKIEKLVKESLAAQGARE